MNEMDKKWTFITNHAVVLTILDRKEKYTSRQIAMETGLTERTVITIINDLISGGYIKKQKIGRMNHYEIVRDQFLRKNRISDIYIQEFFKLFPSD